jgi:hypothetical protein
MIPQFLDDESGKKMFFLYSSKYSICSAHWTERNQKTLLRNLAKII